MNARSAIAIPMLLALATVGSFAADTKGSKKLTIRPRTVQAAPVAPADSAPAPESDSAAPAEATAPAAEPTDSAPAEVSNEEAPALPETASLERPEPAAEGALLPAQETVGLPMDEEGKQSKGKTKINLGKESEENGGVKNLFQDPAVLQMIGEKPRFIYNADQRPDPMVFPPVRNAAIYAELSLQAEALIRDNKFEEAAVVYAKIVDLKDRRYIAEAKQKISEIQVALGAEQAQRNQTQVASNQPVELPDWIRENTSGVLFDKAVPMCLVGDFLLKPGDPIPSYPEVRVLSIAKEKVTYQIASQDFPVDVKGYDDWGKADKNQNQLTGARAKKAQRASVAQRNRASTSPNSSSKSTNKKTY